MSNSQRDLPTSAAQVLGSKTYAFMPCLGNVFQGIRGTVFIPFTDWSMDLTAKASVAVLEKPVACRMETKCYREAG